MKIIIPNQVKRDLKEIYKFISKDSVKYAIETTKNIRICMHNLEKAPYVGRYVPEFSDKHFRELIYKSYRIIYSVLEKENIIYIHTVFHSRRNLKSFRDL